MKTKGSQTKMWTAMAAFVVLIAAASPARAEERLIADVPFGFVVGTSHLPAGHYVVTRNDDPAVVSIANANGHDFTFVLTIAGSQGDNEQQPELVFKKYGNERFLSEIVTTGTEAREIPLDRTRMAEEVEHVAMASFR
jgi:hypothetical protein